MRQAGAKRSKLPICGGIKAEFADDVIFRSLGNLVRKWPKNSRETPYSAPEVIVGLLIDLSKQPRPCIPAKLVRCAAAAPKFFSTYVSNVCLLKSLVAPKWVPCDFSQTRASGKLLSTHTGELYSSSGCSER